MLDHLFVPQLDVTMWFRNKMGPRPTITGMWRGTWTKHFQEDG
jgi:hypothetical protein